MSASATLRCVPLRAKRDASRREPGKRTFSDGRSEVILPPREFIARLCALIPPPRVHLVRYFGAFAPTARGRAALVGRSPKTTTVAPASRPPAAPALGDPPDDPKHPARLEWAALLRRVHRVPPRRGSRLHRLR